MDLRSSFASTLRTGLSLSGFAACLVCSKPARAEGTSRARTVNLNSDRSRDGAYHRFDGDLDLGLGLGVEFGSAGKFAPAVRGGVHYFSIAGVYTAARLKAGAASAPSLFDLGVDVRPLFVPRWAKGYETGPALFDLALDSLSFSLGAFWSGRSHEHPAARGFEAALGFGIPFFASAAGPWLEGHGMLRYPDSAPREEALLVTLAWHGFVVSPLISSP